MANDHHDGRPPLDDMPADMPRVDPLGRTERDRADPMTEPPGSAVEVMQQRPSSGGGAEAERARRRLMDLLFPGEHREPLKIGKYIVEELIGVGGLIGQGGMGLVYAVRDEVLERRCVAKLIRGAASKDAVERAMREASLLAQLDHMNVVSVFDSGVTDDNEFFIIMEFIEGATLDAWHSEARAWRDVVEIYAMAGRGLAEAHREAVIHRDFKPHNVMIVEPRASEPTQAPQDRGRLRRLADYVRGKLGSAEGPPAPARQVKVLDFGLAALTVRPVPEPGTERQILPHTQQGARMGTFGYMAPEQLNGLPADARSDQFSFCVSLYQGLFGRLPFGPLKTAENETSTLQSLQSEYEQRAKRGDIDVPIGLRGAPARLFHAVLRRGLAVDPEQRFRTMDVLLKALDRELQRRGRIRRRLGLGASLALGGVLGGWSLQMLTGPDQCLAFGPALGQAWDPDRDVEDLRLALPDEQVREQVIQQLNRFRDEWLVQRIEACRAASQVDREGTVECLDDHLEVFTGIVRGLTEGSANARLDLEDVAGVLGLGECGTRGVAVSPHRSPEAQAQARSIRSLLATAEAKLLLADYSASLTAAEQALTAARALAEPRLLARTLNQLARARTYSPDRAGVVDLLDQAAEIAERHGLDDVAADVYLRRLRLAALSDPPNEAEARAFDAVLQATLRRMATSGLQRDTDRLLYLAKLETSLRRFDVAEVLAAQAQERWANGSLFEQARVRDVLGGIAYARGKYDLALEQFTEALGLREQMLGKVHPRLISALAGLALTQIHRGAFPAAAALIHRAQGLITAGSHDPIDALYVHSAAALLADHLSDTAKIPEVRAALVMVDRMGLGDAARARELDLVDALLSLSFQAGDREGVIGVCRRIYGYLPLHRARSGFDYILARGGIAASEFGEHELADELLSSATPGKSTFRANDVAEYHLARARTKLALREPGIALGQAGEVLTMRPDEVEPTIRAEAGTIRARALAQLFAATTALTR